MRDILRASLAGHADRGPRSRARARRDPSSTPSRSRASGSRSCRSSTATRSAASIAAASIVAKVYRDRLLDELGRRYPAYGFEHHKGYGTPEHWEALRCAGRAPSTA